jgi:peptidoglycan/LPS O-acetylase OafA/YrhL
MRKQILNLAFSTKITVFSLFLSVAIVCVHLNPTWDFQTITNDGGFFDVVFNYLNDLLTSLGSLAVSFFFLSSAYLLYRTYHPKQFSDKLKRRIRTLFIPLLLWNILCLIYKLRFGDGFFETLKNIVLSNYDGPLWFVVQILVLFLLSPLFLQVFKNKHVGLGMIVVLYFLPAFFDAYLVHQLTDNEQQLAVLSRTVYYIPIYFTGAYLGMHFDKSVQEELYRKGFVMIISCLVLLLTLLPFSHPALSFLMQFQVLAIWVLVPKKRFTKPLNWVWQISFFIYASHAIVIGVVMRFLHKFILDETLPVSIGTALCCRLLFLVLSISCIYLAAWILIRWFPKIYSLLTGGRVPDTHLKP